MKFEHLNILITAAKKASEAICEIYKTDFSVALKEDHSPVTIADKTSSKIICNHLERTGVLILSEEEKTIPYERRKNGPIWLVDPLDGTKEFIKKNNEFCICIALIIDEKPVFGLIADPIGQKMIFGGKDYGAFEMSYDADVATPLQQIRNTESVCLLNSRSHLSPKVEELKRTLEQNGETVTVAEKGSALKFFDLVKGKAQLYPRFGPTMEWDIASGQAIYEAVGGEVVDFINFEPMKYNKASLFNTGFIAKPKYFLKERFL